MPNIVGGDQMHPAYSPRKLKENEVMVDSILYTISINKKNVKITHEDVDGSKGNTLENNAPEEVKNKIRELQK